MLFQLEYSDNHTETEDIATVKIGELGTVLVILLKRFCPQRILCSLFTSSVINVFNSLPYNVEDVVSLRVDSVHVTIRNNQSELAAQVEPYIHKGEVSQETFLVSGLCHK